MLDYSEELVDLVGAGDVEGSLADRTVKLAAERLLEIIGEAASRVPEFARQGIDIPWKRIVGLRNRLIHAYDDTEPAILVEIVATQVPLLAARVRAALKEA